MPGFSTSSRTLAVWMLGSRICPILLIAALQEPVRIGVQLDIRILAHVHLRQIVFIHVADDPHVRHVGDRERDRATIVP